MEGVLADGALATSLPGPVSWNCWQKLHRALNSKGQGTHGEYQATMERAFGLQWRVTIRDLSASDIEMLAAAHSCAPPSRNAVVFQAHSRLLHVVTGLEAPISWNNLQALQKLACGKHAQPLTAAVYHALMLRQFGRGWQERVQILSAAQLAAVVCQEDVVASDCLEAFLPVLQSLRRPLYWNDWQRVFGTQIGLAKYGVYSAAMGKLFPGDWKTKIETLSAEEVAELHHRVAALVRQKDVATAESLDAYMSVLQLLQRPLNWNDWQRVFGTVFGHANYWAYLEAMGKLFPPDWKTKIETLSAEDVAELHHRVVSLQQGSQARGSLVGKKQRGGPVRSMWSRLRHLESVVGEVCRTVDASLATRLSGAAFAVREAVLRATRKRPKRRLHPKTLGNLRPRPRRRQKPA